MATYRGEAIDLMPTDGMREEAARGLAWREEFNRGGTEVGVGSARAILSGDELSPEKVVQMASYFARHEVDKQGEGFSPDEDGFPSAGRIAWALWGGDPGQVWSGRKREALMRIDESVDSGTRAIKRAAFACEFKTYDNGPVGRFSGYGAVFNNIDAYGERIVPGAFADTLDRAQTRGVMPAMLWQHDPTQPLGVWRTMREDERGLYVEGELADTQLGREAYALLKLGALSGLSIGFSVKKDAVNGDDKARDLLAIDLWEVSAVTFPANTEARVQQVKFTGPDMSIREFERFLRDVGSFSATQAKAIAARGFKALRDEAAESDIDENWLADMAKRLSA